jgi:hypothetical protein
MKRCTIDGCKAPARKRTWCETHYSKYKVYGDPLVAKNSPLGDKCVIARCDKQPIAKQLCRQHYYRSRHPQKDKEKKGRCAALRCGRPAKTRAWCPMHYQRWRRFGDPDFYPCLAKNSCKVPACTRPTNALGLCGSHYYRLQKYGTPGTVEDIRAAPRPHAFAKRRCSTCRNFFDPQNSAVRKYCGKRCKPSGRISGSVNKRFWVEKLGSGTGWHCRLCDSPIDKSLRWPHPQAGSVDHIVPVSHGGTDASSNLQLTHLHCNVSRRNKPLTRQQVRSA